MSVGTLVAFTTFQSALFFPIGQLLNIQVEFQGALALFDRIFQYLDLPVEIEDRAGRDHHPGLPDQGPDRLRKRDLQLRPWLSTGGRANHL